MKINEGKEGRKSLEKQKRYRLRRYLYATIYPSLDRPKNNFTVTINVQPAVTVVTISRFDALYYLSIEFLRKPTSNESSCALYAVTNRTRKSFQYLCALRELGQRNGTCFNPDSGEFGCLRRPTRRPSCTIGNDSCKIVDVIGSLVEVENAFSWFPMIWHRVWCGEKGVWK